MEDESRSSNGNEATPEELRITKQQLQDEWGENRTDLQYLLSSSRSEMYTTVSIYQTQIRHIFSTILALAAAAAAIFSIGFRSGSATPIGLIAAGVLLLVDAVVTFLWIRPLT
ncbi:unnamed protein product, partial [marine sediment metagenome]